jgi:insulysin
VFDLNRRERRLDHFLHIVAVTPAQVRQHLEALLSQFETRMLVVGNMYKDEAVLLAKMTEEMIPSSPPPGLGPVDFSLRLPEGVS